MDKSIHSTNRIKYLIILYFEAFFAIFGLFLVIKGFIVNPENTINIANVLVFISILFYGTIGRPLKFSFTFSIILFMGDILYSFVQYRNSYSNMSKLCLIISICCFAVSIVMVTQTKMTICCMVIAGLCMIANAISRLFDVLINDYTVIQDLEQCYLYVIITIFYLLGSIYQFVKQKELSSPILIL